MMYRCTVCQRVTDIPTSSAFPHCVCGSSAWVSPPEPQIVATGGYVHNDDKAELYELRDQVKTLQSRLDACELLQKQSLDKWMTRSKELDAIRDLVNGDKPHDEYSQTVAYKLVDALQQRAFDLERRLQGCEEELATHLKVHLGVVADNQVLRATLFQAQNAAIDLSYRLNTTLEKLAGISPYLDTLQRYGDAWYHLAIEYGMKASVASAHAKHVQDAINGARSFIPLQSQVVEKPVILGVDMASGPDVTVGRCMRCGSIQRQPLIGPLVCPNCGPV